MGAINGRVIYSPKGKAGEYAENAANFYVGCSNGCTYCYLRKGWGAKVLGGNTPELKKALREYPYALDIFTNELLKHKDGDVAVIIYEPIQSVRQIGFIHYPEPNDENEDEPDNKK